LELVSAPAAYVGADYRRWQEPPISLPAVDRIFSSRERAVQNFWVARCL